jgi:hypothetical protein
MFKLEKYSKKFGKIVIIYVLAWVILFILTIADFYFRYLELLFGPTNADLPWGFLIGIIIIYFGLPILLILIGILVILIILKK